ncbi:MAG: hypothetical protein KDD33_06555, partial [Bdellovibrionales bacterium]|nr:hypothetical protein [Bdellovibrionales bacterium]
DLFFTSRHCVPNDLLEKGASCAGRIKVIFPGIGHQMPIEEVGCESIEDLAPIVDGLNPQAPQPDWAILKLSKKLPQRVSATTTEGAEDGEKLYAFAPLWDPRNNTITTRTIECEAVQNSLEFPNFSKRSSIMMYLYCSQKMTNGFSGTLLFDSKGKDAKVVGAVSHIYNPDARGQEVHLSDKVIASNLSCILADPKKPIPDECQFKKGERHDKGKRLWKRFLPKLKEKADELFADWEKVADSPIEWTKIDKDNWNQLPESYEQYFKKFQEKGFQDLEGEETNEYAQIVVPSFAKCVKDPATAKNKEIIIPVLELKFNRQNRGRARPEIKLLEIKGRIHKNSDTEFVIVREDSLPGSPDGKDYIFTGYFSHSTAMPPCE